MLGNKTVHELRDLLRRREIASLEIVEAFLKRIEEVEDRIQSFITINGEQAKKEAIRIDGLFKNGEALGDLAGIPMALKDNIITKGLKTTAGSKILRNYTPPYDATVVKKLKKEHAIIIGKTNMDEFAMGASTEYSAFHITRNPWDLSRVPGGSSGGSAAAVACGEVPIALGSSTGGSVRQPASFTGIIGLKPTYGLVSRYGLIGFASSLDQIGIMARDVEDCSIVLRVIGGLDPLDSTSVNKRQVEDKISSEENMKGKVLGIPKEYFTSDIDPEVRERVVQAIKEMESLGARLEEVTLPHTAYALSAYYILSTAEASSNLARFDGIRYGLRGANYDDMEALFVKNRTEGLGEEVKRRMMFGTYALSSKYYEDYYQRAQKVRGLIKNDFHKAFEKCDGILAPTTPTTAFKIGEKSNDPLAMTLSDALTVSVNLAGICGISLPCGYVKGLPVGVQIIGEAFEEDKLLKLAYPFVKRESFSMKIPQG